MGRIQFVEPFLLGDDGDLNVQLIGSQAISNHGWKIMPHAGAFS